MQTEADPYDILRWYLDAGVDETIGEVPVDRYAALLRAQQARGAAAQNPVVQTTAARPGVAHRKRSARNEALRRSEHDPGYANAR